MDIKNFNPIQHVKDDGLEIPEVGPWGIEKYRCQGYYAEIFTKSMRPPKWNRLVYIDLFASSGYCRIEDTGDIIKSGALIALSITNKFSRYIFCEKEARLLNSLKQRVERDHPGIDAHFVLGDCNDKISDIINLIPRYSKGNTVLSFAFIDPFALNIKFSTIRLLTNYQLDILMLIATGMAAVRNKHNYIQPSNETIDNFLDDTNWRMDYQGGISLKEESFTQFLTERLKGKLEKLGYTKASAFHPVKYRLSGKNVLLYHLAFFSKHPLGNSFWDIVRRQYAGEQSSLF